MCLFLSVAVSHSGHHDSLVRGIVICYTKSVGNPHGGHGGRVVCTPVERGRARCCGDSSKFLLARGLVAVCTPPHHPPPALHVLGLTCCPTPAPQHRESPLAQIRLMEEGCLGIAQFHGMQPLQCVLWVPQVLRTSQLQTIFGPPHFDVSGDSKEFCKSDIVVPLTRMQAEGKKC
jgi:hypothetical protein